MLQIRLLTTRNKMSTELEAIKNKITIKQSHNIFIFIYYFQMLQIRLSPARNKMSTQLEAITETNDRRPTACSAH